MPTRSILEPPYSEAARLYRYWAALPATRPRAALSPIAIGARLLPHCSLAHVLEDGADLRYDLIGEVLEAVGPRVRPGSLASAPLRVDPENTNILGYLRDCARGQRPVAFEAAFLSMDGVPRRVFSLLLPLSIEPEAAAARDMLIGVWEVRRDPGPLYENYRDSTVWFCDAMAGGDG